MAKHTGKTTVRNTTAPPSPTPAAKSSGMAMHIKLCLLLAAIACMVYANTLKNGFAVDDNVMLTHNAFVMGGVESIPKLLVTPHQMGYWINDNDEYRPLSLVLFAAEYQLWGLAPQGYHLMNILLFAGCVALLFLFLYELLERKRILVAFVAAGLFALHPIHTEVVANVKSSDELLSFLLAFGGLLLCTKYMRTGKGAHLAAAVLCFFMAHLAKESVVTLIAIVPVVFYFFITGDKRRSLYISLGFAGAALLFIAVRYAVLSHWGVNNTPEVLLIENALVAPGLSAATRLATAILMMGMYLKLLFVPYPLISDYSYHTIPFVGFGNPVVWLTIAAYAGLAVVAVRRFIKDRRDPYAFAILFFFVTIALFSNIIIPIKSTMGERFLFYPSVGFCLAMALLLERWAGNAGIAALRQTKVLAVLLPVCLCYAGIAIARNNDWMDDYTIYKTDVAKVPDNTHLNYEYGYYVFARYHQEQDPAERQKLIVEAIDYFKRAYAIYPEYMFVPPDLGAAYFCNGQLDSAEHYDKIAVRVQPKFALVRNNLSGVYMNRKKYRENVALCRESIALLPDNLNGYADLGISYKQLGIYDSAVYYVRMGMNREPRYIRFYEAMSDVYYGMGRMDSANVYRSMVQGMTR